MSSAVLPSYRWRVCTVSGLWGEFWSSPCLWEVLARLVYISMSLTCSLSLAVSPTSVPGVCSGNGHETFLRSGLLTVPVVTCGGLLVYMFKTLSCTLCSAVLPTSVPGVGSGRGHEIFLCSVCPQIHVPTLIISSARGLCFPPSLRGVEVGWFSLKQRGWSLQVHSLTLLDGRVPGACSYPCLAFPSCPSMHV